MASLLAYGVFRLLKCFARAKSERVVRLQVQVFSLLLEGIAASYLTLLFTTPPKSGDIRNGIDLLRRLESKDAELECITKFSGQMLQSINEALDPSVRERFRR